MRKLIRQKRHCLMSLFLLINFLHFRKILYKKLTLLAIKMQLISNPILETFYLNRDKCLFKKVNQVEEVQ